MLFLAKTKSSVPLMQIAFSKLLLSSRPDERLSANLGGKAESKETPSSTRRLPPAFWTRLNKICAQAELLPATKRLLTTAEHSLGRMVQQTEMLSRIEQGIDYVAGKQQQRNEEAIKQGAAQGSNPPRD